ncbi:MAG: GWxTD domain-containing protein, partial [Gemmatimonadaceae bacterium]
MAGVLYPMRRSRRAFIQSPMLCWLALSAACYHGNRGGAGGRNASPNSGGFLSGQAPDLGRVYQSMGLITSTGQIPFVGSVSFLGGPTADTTLMLLAVSLPSSSLSFQRVNEQYAANYTVRVELRQGTTVVQQWDAKESVRVPTFKETARTDESVIWQQYLRVAPGEYSLTVGLKDESVIRNSAQEVTIVVPRVAAGELSSPIPVYEAISRSRLDSLPRMLARPRSSVSFATDSILPIYLEASGVSSPTLVNASLSAEGNTVVWRDSLTIVPSGGSVTSRMLSIPVKKMGIGIVTLSVARAGTNDTSRTRLFVTLGDDLPIASFEEMIRYLKYFASTERLKILRDATPANRPQAWADFLRVTDPVPATSENEGLRDYFNRIRTANVRFHDDAIIGWQSDRGTAFVGLGEPDRIYDAPIIDPAARSRQQVWEYTGEIRVQLVFVDNGGMGRFRLSSSGVNELEAA